jgi:transposase
MQTITTIGFDIAKSVFQVHGVDAAGQVVIRRQLKRELHEQAVTGGLSGQAG